MNIAMILAGGVGSRVGAGIPKQFINVLGKPVIAYTIEIFQQNKNIDYIEVVCHPKWKETMNEIIQQYNLTKVKWIVDGGSTFQESVINGKDYLEGKISEDDTVMIHYGGSPFTSQKIVEDVLKKTQKFGMAASCTPSYQLLGTNNGDKSTEWVDRDKIIQIAAPQGFKYKLLLDIYKKAEEKGILKTAEPHTTSLMYELGMPIYQAYGDQTNIKITTKEDIKLFKGFVLSQENETEV